MFELEKAVAAWAQAANAGQCHGAASVAEHTDHLYCEIDRARAEGLSDEQAFAAAVARLGPPSKLAAEHTKNRSVLGTVCAVAARIERFDLDASHRGPLIAHALIWASLMIAVSLFLPKGVERAQSATFLVVVLVPMWLASEQILLRALRQSSRGGRR